MIKLTNDLHLLEISTGKYTKEELYAYAGSCGIGIGINIRTHTTCDYHAARTLFCDYTPVGNVLLLEGSHEEMTYTLHLFIDSENVWHFTMNESLGVASFLVTLSYVDFYQDIQHVIDQLIFLHL